MNHTIDPQAVYNLDGLKDENDVIVTDRLYYDLSDKWSTMLQKHNGVVSMLGNNQGLNTVYKGDIVGAVNESLEMGIKAALVFGM